MQAWALPALAVGAGAAYCDGRGRRIPRGLTVPALILGVAGHLWWGGGASALAACGLGLGLGLGLMQLGAFGGGDVKLLGALGALLGLPLWFWSVAFGMIAAALWALAQYASRGRLGMLPGALRAIAQGWRRQGWRPHPDYNLTTPGALTAPFAVAMGIGLVCALLRMG